MKRLTAFLLIAPVLSACQMTASQPDLAIDAAHWRADLEILRIDLPKRHINAFHAVSKEQFDAAIDLLEDQASIQNADTRLVGLIRAVSLIGDGHTGVRLPSNRAYFPIEIQEFDGEFRVARTAPGFEQALGTQVLKINETGVGEAMNQALELTPADENTPLRRDLAANYLGMGLVLHGMHVIPDRTVAYYSFRDDDGRIFDMDLPANPTRNKAAWVRPNAQVFLADQHQEDPFWCVNLPSARTIYCEFRSYHGLASRCAGMVKLISQAKPEKLVIDMRDNGGGDNTVGERYLIQPIKRVASINRNGHLFILIGSQTFSAAMNNAAQFRSQTAATLVGETIGEKPNSYQEPREMTLPNSKLIIRYSTRWYAFVPNGPNAVEPDVPVVRSWAEYAAGQDSALNYALAFRPDP